MNIAKAMAVVLASIGCFAGGLYGAPAAVSTYHRLFPEPDFRVGDFRALHAQAQSDVVMFSTSTCPYCKKTRELLDAQNIKYTDYVIDQSKDAEAMFEQRGGGAVPLIYIGDREIRGLREPVIHAALALIDKPVNAR